MDKRLFLELGDVPLVWPRRVGDLALPKVSEEKKGWRDQVFQECSVERDSSLVHPVIEFMHGHVCTRLEACKDSSRRTTKGHLSLSELLPEATQGITCYTCSSSSSSFGLSKSGVRREWSVFQVLF